MKEWLRDIIIGTVIAFIAIALVWASVLINRTPCGG